MAALGVDSEVGRLRTVLLHRPGDELRRLTPRNSADLLFDGVPWVDRAQAEHDAFAAALREHGVEVLYVQELLAAALADPAAREGVVAAAVRPELLGAALAADLRAHLAGYGAAELAAVVVAGMAHRELPVHGGLADRMLDPRDFVVPPLPNLLFTRDSSIWVGPRVAVSRPAMPARRREGNLLAAIYLHHPRFAGTPLLDGGEQGRVAGALEGGDVLLLAPGVVAVGVGQRTTPAGAESFARRLFRAGVARTVLAVPIAQERATMHLDTVATMVDRDAVLMYPPAAAALRGYVLTPAADERVAVAGPYGFLDAAAGAMGIPRLRVVDTGLDPVTAEREQWDDGNNMLCVAPGTVLAYERNTQTNARLVDAGIRVVPIAGSELGSGRGGPRCMSCPVRRDPLDGSDPAAG